MCPYYHQKMRLQEADVIFMPYNYLLDSGFREGLKLRMERAIVIIDEGHNIAQAAEQSYSFKITLANLQMYR